MNGTNLMRVAVLALVAATGMQAAEPAKSESRWDAGAALVLPLDGLKAVTQKSGLGGMTAELGYNGRVYNTQLPFRVSASVNALPGEQKDYVKSSLLGLQLAADIVAPTGIDKLSMVVGISVNQWRWDYQDPTTHSKTTMKGPKAGFRWGFDYRLNRHWSASALLQMTELGVDAQAAHGYNPSWIQAGAKYRF